MTPSDTFAVVVPSVPGYPHTEAFREVAETVFYGLRAMGEDVVMSTVCPEGRRSIVFGSNVLHTHPTFPPMPPDTILYNLEQCDAPIAETLLPLFARYEVWDYSARNVAFWKARGIRAKLVPIGYASQMTRIVNQPKDIDVLFYGSLNSRRERILGEIRKRGLKVEHVAVYGADRDAFIARSKVVLNMHFYEPGIFEAVRVLYLLANEVCVVSETGLDEDPFHFAVYSAKYDELVDACVACVRDDHFRKQQAQRGFEMFSQIDEPDILREALEDTGRCEARCGRPVALYLDLLKNCLTRSAFETLTAEALAERRVGMDWPADAETMVGHSRLDNVQECIEAVRRDGVPGDLCEAGVWRGGTTIFMRGVLEALGDNVRTVWVADSFEGLPRPEDAYPLDKGDPHHGYSVLAVSLDEVRANFSRYGLLDDRVRFLKGWFKDTLPGPIEQLALLRLDGDMYGSTIQTLDALYDKVSPGGFIIVDDYALPGCRAAVDDFRLRREIAQPILKIDWTGVYWRKER